MAENVASPLPLLTLTPGMTIEVDVSDASATVTSLTVKVFQISPSTPRTGTPILIRSGR